MEIDGSASFVFNDSIYHSTLSNNLDKDNLITTFCCILNDAFVYISCYCLYDFARCFGYDIEEADGIHNECWKTLNKLNSIGLSDDNIGYLINSEELEKYM